MLFYFFAIKMRNLFLSLGIFIIGIFGLIFGFTNAYNNQQVGDLLIDALETETKNDDLDQKIERFEEIIFNLNSALDFVQWSTKSLLEYLVSAVEDSKIELEKELAEQEAETDNNNTNNNWEENISNVDWDTVRNTVLAWHNEVRAKKGLWNYVIEEKLNQTANMRASHLADINYATHKRLSSDGYYTYSSIQNWFNNQWVYFEWAGTQFTESIWYRDFNCNKSDCTQELLDTMRKSFNFYMSEESWNGPHYRAVVHPQFTYMGIGFDDNGQNSFLVIHYSNKVL